MAVVINQTAGANYTWQSASWDWNSVNAGKTWGTAYAIAWVCTESDAAPSFAVSRPKSIAALDFEAWATAEARSDVWAAFVKPNEAFSVAESYSDICDWIQANLEAWSTVTTRPAAFTKRPSEAWATSEARRSAVGVAEYETFAFAESQADVIAFVKVAAELFSVTDQRSDVWVAYVNPNESFSVAEARRFSMAVAESESFSTAEARSDVWAAISKAQESLALLSSAPKLVTKPRSSAFSFAEVQTEQWQAFRNHAETIAWTESYIDNINWTQANNETLALSELSGGVFTKRLAESFSLVDARRALAGKVSPESLAFSETYTDIINWIQANLESFQFSESSPTGITKRISRALRVRDMMLRGANGVYGDITVRNYAMTGQMFQEFMNTRSPSGYEAFKPFLPGDYSFQTALINAAVVPVSGAADTMSIQGMTTVIDVPDVTDRGSVQLSSAGATVSFARTFTVIPEVLAQQTAGASTAIPVITNITLTSFFVRLYSAASPTTGVAGTISWSAAGY